MTHPSLGTLGEVRIYVHTDCPVALVTTSPRVEVQAGRPACTACGAWWTDLQVGSAPTGQSASDPGPRPKPRRPRHPKGTQP